MWIYMELPRRYTVDKLVNYFQAFQGLRRLTKRYNSLTTINNWEYVDFLCCL